MSDLKATVFDIERNSFVDGPGIRTTVFFKGCNLSCAWCHNPESRNKAPELMLYKDKCTGCGACRAVCKNGEADCTRCALCAAVCKSGARILCGREYTVGELMRECIKDEIFFRASGGGVSFSGGECMLQIDFLEQMLKECQSRDIHTAVDTAGAVPFSYFERIIPYTDLFLYDIKCMDREIHKRYTGVSNELILENLRKLIARNVNITLRIPIILGVNDRMEEMLAVKNFLFESRKKIKVELLPYHSMGEYKYSALGRAVPAFCAPADEKMRELRAVFDACGG